MSTSRTRGRRTVAVSRSKAAPVETDEIRDLVRTAGGTVVAEVTQVGPAEPGTYVGAGKLDSLAATVERHDVARVVVDDELTPAQHHAIASAMPEGTAVVDRYRLVLEIFERGAGSRRAQLQVELATLRYELPRLIESADEGLLNKRTEKGSPVYDVRDRIARLERTLAELPDPTEQFRERRREEGFDLVTIAGYTNAGKSTLLHRLGDDLSLEAIDSKPVDSSQKDATASIADRLFETLETTTRRATIGGRPVLVTDTVGFVDDLPHDLVESFSSTLSEAAVADVVVLVVDASDPPEPFRERLTVALEVLAAQDVDDERLVTVLNKVDRLSSSELARRHSIAESLVPDDAQDPIPVSVLEGTNLEALSAAIQSRLPEARVTLSLPNCDEAMALLSRAYDRAIVDAVAYEGDEVTIECRGRPSVLERLRATAESVDPV
ncbi:GTPase HflX [Natronobeatus ordinarius]|uniref:GTPase HflX n=1 Tax=Natronobeatus ordinarius TaxID=2963433 RepID=UPI0020CEC20C|nr:GTPase HflX [Natronobeatus ordinarius]